jgi:hypothetical protein
MTGTSGVLFPDDFKLNIGTGSDLQIYHDGTHNYIDGITNDLYIRTVTPGDDVVVQAYDDLFLYVANGVDALIARGGGTVELYHNGAKKLETTSTGVTVTGDILAPRYDIGTSSTSVIQETNRMKFTNSIANDAGGFDFYTRKTDSTYINALQILGTGNATFAGNISAAIGAFNSGTTNVVSTFTSTDGTATLQCVDSVGNVEFGASGNNFVVQPAGGLAQLTVGATTSTFAGNVGVGTTNPDAIFHVAKSTSGGVGGQIVIDNPASSALGNTAELSFLTDVGASGSGTRNAKILAVNVNAGNGAAELQFHTWNGAEELKRLNIASNGVITMGAYGSGNVTGTPTYNLAVDASGNIIETPGRSSRRKRYG